MHEFRCVLAPLLILQNRFACAFSASLHCLRDCGSGGLTTGETVTSMPGICISKRRVSRPIVLSVLELPSEATIVQFLILNIHKMLLSVKEEVLRTEYAGIRIQFCVAGLGDESRQNLRVAVR